MNKGIINKYGETKKRSSMWRYLGVIIILLFGCVLVSCEHKLKQEETIYNNGGTVLLAGDTTYFYAPNDNVNNLEMPWAIYAMKDISTDKTKVIETHGKEGFYIVDNKIYVSDNTDSGSVILNVFLDTRKTKTLCKGTLEYINTQQKELYLTVNNNDLPMDENGIYKMNIGSGDMIKLCSIDYIFIAEADGLVYLQAPHANPSHDAILASVNSDGTNLKTIATIPSNIYEGIPEDEYVVDFGVCDDWMILSVGCYQGVAQRFLGGLVRMKKDGKQLEYFYKGNINSFDIDDGWIYLNSWCEILNGDGKNGCYRMRPDLSEKVFLGEKIHEMYSFMDGYLFYRYDPIHQIAERIINDLRLCSYDGQNIVTLFHGRMAPQNDHSTYTRYGNIEVVGDDIYFSVFVDGCLPSDRGRDHTCYEAYYRVHKDGSSLELLYEVINLKYKDSAEDIIYVEYDNGLFDYSIKHPNTFAIKKLPIDGDGAILESMDGRAKLTVLGINNVMDITAESSFDEFMKEHKDIVSQVQKDNYFIASWIEGDKILYKKEVVGSGSINSFTFEYPLEEEEYYKHVVDKLIESFWTPGILNKYAMSSMEGNYDCKNVRNLFIKRFLIASPDKNNITYALKSNPLVFAYKVFVDRFDARKGMYVIRLSLCDDTAHNYYYYDPVTEKFYEYGENLEEIIFDDSIFFG